MAMPVAASIPPMTSVPIICRAMAPEPLASASGTLPKINAKDVISIGRSRSLAPDSAASSSASPFSCSFFANSTMSMAFLAARPINTMSPICA